MDDEDFWTTYISVTPEEDENFNGCSNGLLWIAGIIVVILAVAWLVS